MERENGCTAHPNAPAGGRRLRGELDLPLRPPCWHPSLPRPQGCDFVKVPPCLLSPSWLSTHQTRPRGPVSPQGLSPPPRGSLLHTCVMSRESGTQGDSLQRDSHGTLRLWSGDSDLDGRDVPYAASLGWTPRVHCGPLRISRLLMDPPRPPPSTHTHQ